jgi:hypothetical protein
MNALRQLPHDPRREPKRQPERRKVRRPAPQSHQTRVLQQHRSMAVESMMKVGVNLGVSIVALSTLVHLLPYRSTQTQKLQEVQGEVQRTEMRVGQLQADFGRNFDTNQVKSILQEQTHMVDPSQKAIVFDERAGDGQTEKPAQTLTR